VCTVYFNVIHFQQVKQPKGIPAGGIKISVSGKNLAFIQSPEMYVYYNNKKFTSVSKIIVHFTEINKSSNKYVSALALCGAK
jgi:hypothetical protein